MGRGQDGKRITKEDVERGYERGIVCFCDGSNVAGMGSTVCRIGTREDFNWFFFGGDEAVGATPQEFVERVGGLDDAIGMVADALNDTIYEIDRDEYEFYAAVLAECEEV